MLNQHQKNLLWAGNIWYFGEGMLGPIFAVFTERIGGDVLDVAWAWAIFLAVTGVLIIYVGKYSDRLREKHGREKLMIVGYALNTIFTFAYIFVDTPMELFFVQAGLGIAVAFAAPTWLALYDQYSDNKHDGYMWGLEGGQMRLVQAVAILIGGLLVKYFSFVTLFLIMGCIQLLATIYQAKILYLTKR